MVSYVDGDVSTSTTSVSSVAGLNWVSHNASDIAIVGWALVNLATPTLDAGLTSSSNVVDTNVRGIIGTDVTSGSESGAISLTCDAPNANRMCGALALYRGCTLGQIVSLSEASGTAQTSHTSPTITPANGASGYALVFVERVGSTVAPAGTPSGFTKRQEFSTGGTGGTSVVIYDDLSGTHGTSPWTPANVVSLTASTSAIVFLIELPPAGFTGNLGMSGSGALTFAATPAHTGTDALAGAGVLTGTATPAIPGTDALSGSGQLTSTAVVAVAGSLALSGSGQIAGIGTPVIPGALGLSGAGTASDAGTPSVGGSTAFAGAGTLTEAGQPALPGDLHLAGSGTLQGLGGNNFGGPVALAGSGALGLNGTPAIQGNESLSSIGHLDFTASIAVSGLLDLAGEGGLTAAGAAGFPGDLVLAGTGSLILTGAPAFAGALSLGGIGVLDPSGAEAPPAVPGRLTAAVSQSLTAADRYSVLTATTEPTSRLEASDGV